MLYCKHQPADGPTALDVNILTTYNPFRYRGYYYDVETQWYYLQSRYYNPDWCRFLNADGYINANGDIIGFNMFAYCSNNPIIFVDDTGAYRVAYKPLASGAGGLPISSVFHFNVSPQVRFAATKGSLIGSIAAFIASLFVDSSPEVKTEEKDKKQPKDPLIFYGVRFIDGEWTKVTRGMNFEQTLSWIGTTYHSGEIKKRTLWGVYTFNREDAKDMAVFLGGGLQPQEDINQSGCYPHFHTSNRRFGYTKGFHIWYGLKNP